MIFGKSFFWLHGIIGFYKVEKYNFWIIRSYPDENSRFSESIVVQSIANCNKRLYSFASITILDLLACSCDPCSSGQWQPHTIKGASLLPRHEAPSRVPINMREGPEFLTQLHSNPPSLLPSLIVLSLLPLSESLLRLGLHQRSLFLPLFFFRCSSPFPSFVRVTTSERQSLLSLFRSSVLSSDQSSAILERSEPLFLLSPRSLLFLSLVRLLAPSVSIALYGVLELYQPRKRRCYSFHRICARFGSSLFSLLNLAKIANRVKMESLLLPQTIQYKLHIQVTAF